MQQCTEKIVADHNGVESDFSFGGNMKFSANIFLGVRNVEPFIAGSALEFTWARQKTPDSDGIIKAGVFKRMPLPVSHVTEPEIELSTSLVLIMNSSPADYGL